jgi:hypothetical protein
MSDSNEFLGWIMPGLATTTKGGKGSGNFGHVGRPGHVGGSGEGGGQGRVGGSAPHDESLRPVTDTDREKMPEMQSFAAKMLANPGGFTLHPSKDTPKTGKMVAVAGHELKISAEDGVDLDEVEAYYRREISFVKAHPGAYFGGWIGTDPDDGKKYFFLDISFRYNTHYAATRASIKNKQLAYFDLGNFTEHSLNDPKVIARFEKEKARRRKKK